MNGDDGPFFRNKMGDGCEISPIFGKCCVSIVSLFALPLSALPRKSDSICTSAAAKVGQPASTSPVTPSPTVLLLLVAVVELLLVELLEVLVLLVELLLVEVMVRVVELVEVLLVEVLLVELEVALVEVDLGLEKCLPQKLSQDMLLQGSKGPRV